MAEASPLYDAHMTDLEALMWSLESDPRLSSNVANLSLFSGPLDVETFKSRMLGACERFPRLVERVAPSFGKLAPPRWERDPDFDIDHHVRVISLKGRGSLKQVRDIACRSYAEPFDRTRPLWDFLIIEGMRDGRSAMVQKLHHTLTDGEGALKLSLEFIDLGPASRPKPPGAEVHPAHEPAPPLSSAVDAIAHLGRRQLGMARRNVETAIRLMTHPQELREGSTQLTRTVRSLAGQATMEAHPLSPMWQQRSLARRIATLEVPFRQAKSAAGKLGGTLNDFFVTGALEGAIRYHDQFGQHPNSLRMAMPISHRSGNALGGNMFAPVQMVVACPEIGVAERFRALHELLAHAKTDPTAAAASSLAGLINWLPSGLLTATSYRYASSIDFVTSNLKGAPFPVYIAGAQMESNFPLGPLAGSAFNLTTLSYNGRLGMGLVMDTAAIEDPDALARSINAAFTELLRHGTATDT